MPSCAIGDIEHFHSNFNNLEADFGRCEIRNLASNIVLFYDWQRGAEYGNPVIWLVHKG